MRNTTVFIVAVVLGSLFSAGCSGGGQRIPGGTVCANSYDPIPLDVKGAQKISMDPAAGELASGTYAYAGADVYYYNRSTGVKIHVAETKNTRTGEWNASIVCVNGFKTSTQPLSFSSEGVSGLIKDAASNKTTFDVRTFTVRFDGKSIIRKFEKGDGSKFDSPSKVYDGKVTQYFLYKMAANDQKNFQIRSIEGDGNISLSVLVRLTRTP